MRTRIRYAQFLRYMPLSDYALLLQFPDGKQLPDLGRTQLWGHMLSSPFVRQVLLRHWADDYCDRFRSSRCIQCCIRSCTFLPFYPYRCCGQPELLPEQPGLQ